MFSLPLPLPLQGLFSRWAALALLGLVLGVLAAAAFAGWRLATWRAAAELASVQRQHAEQVAEWHRLAAAGHALVLGGNQGNAVNVAAFSVDRILGYRWPLGAPAPERLAAMQRAPVALSGSEA